jgi:hypothetical protein
LPSFSYLGGLQKSKGQARRACEKDPSDLLMEGDISHDIIPKASLKGKDDGRELAQQGAQ